MNTPNDILVGMLSGEGAKTASPEKITIINLIEKINIFIDQADKEIALLSETLNPVMNFNNDNPNAPMSEEAVTQKRSDLFEQLNYIVSRIDLLTLSLYNIRRRIEL